MAMCVGFCLLFARKQKCKRFDDNDDDCEFHFLCAMCILMVHPNRLNIQNKMNKSVSFVMQVVSATC